MPKSDPCSVIVFDGDDTLWRTMPLYTRAKNRFFVLMNSLIPDSDGLEADFEARDHKNVERRGFTVERFRVSMLETYRAWVRASGLDPEQRREAQIYRIANSVAKGRAPLVPHAASVLRRLAEVSRLVLLTKGEYEVQRRRIESSGLEGLFHQTVVVERKDPSTFRELAVQLRVDPAYAWSVGDSLRSDIQPALSAGFRAVWIPQKTWSYEEIDLGSGKDGHFLQVSSLQQLPAVLMPAIKAGAR